MASIRDTLNNLARDYAVAWSSGDADAVASFYAPDGEITINRGDPIQGRAAVAEMARGFYAEFPDLEVRCDMMRWAGSHAIFVWTLEGHHSETGNHVVTRGWEEWDMTPDNKVQSSLGWFDADDYQRQIDGK
ncbi:nuclear transport factor 2 family protein [Rhodobacteraceae bacterium B1Z28]|uniref:Nuclear transport factor 2 family protein n=1 Tax=Ruegeria haliotis TaxID=2747601 RepID=A0ABX2PNV0_9RHOB|nr:nuclear transport factor 2 family protein [Ruegeria haliotis]NVO55430.1 nuclear transport factor 2 family protein [Ruegeria haliotis]